MAGQDKKNDRLISFMNLTAKNPKQNVSKLNSVIYKKYNKSLTKCI